MAFFGLSANRWGTLALGAALSFACANVLGISSYEIDPSLDAKGGAGGEPEAPLGGNPTGGSDTPVAGEPNVGGDPNVGGMPSGGAPEPMAGAGGTDPEPKCKVTADCNDAIDCTTDTCSPTGSCVHTPKDTLCDAALCETCQVGLGCVAGKSTVTQLLVNPGFDGGGTDWNQSSSDTPNMLADANAQTPPKSAKFGPASGMGMQQQYSDLYQWVTIPAGTVALTLKGYYKLTPGTKGPAEDSVLCAFYEAGETKYLTSFNQFFAQGDSQAAWKAFSYSIPSATLKDMVGNEYTFDLLAQTWDSVFYFDTLEMNATVCE